MKTVIISEENPLSADAPSGFAGEFAAVPDCIKSTHGTLVCRKHGDNTLIVDGLALIAIHDEDRASALKEAEREGLGDNLAEWVV